MGGRGRGRGRGGRASLSFNVEALGITKGEALPEPVVQPPPVYPPLEGRPAPMGEVEGGRQRLRYRDELISHWAPVRQALAPPPPKPIVDYKAESTEAPTYSLQFQWFKFPAELRPSTKKRKSVQPKDKPRPVKRKAAHDVDTLLSQLEKNEENMDIKTEVDDEEENKDENKEAEGEERELEEEEDADEEMDEGTDYNQNYFDNGDNYLDEEDDMDDGPIY